MRKPGEALAFASSLIGHDGGDCVRWPYRLNTSGYGYFYIASKSVLAHRWLCIQTHGEPIGYREAAHSCGKRWCVNPAHLSWKTKKENSADRLIHGTHQRGANAPWAKLTEEQALHILRSDEPRKVMAARFGISTETIEHIKNGRRWKHLRWTDEQEDAA